MEKRTLKPWQMFLRSFRTSKKTETITLSNGVQVSQTDLNNIEVINPKIMSGCLERRKNRK
jgi:hypothetical protein